MLIRAAFATCCVFLALLCARAEEPIITPALLPAMAADLQGWFAQTMPDMAVTVDADTDGLTLRYHTHPFCEFIEKPGNPYIAVLHCEERPADDGILLTVTPPTKSKQVRGNDTWKIDGAERYKSWYTNAIYLYGRSAQDGLEVTIAYGARCNTTVLRVLIDYFTEWRNPVVAIDIMHTFHIRPRSNDALASSTLDMPKQHTESYHVQSCNVADMSVLLGHDPEHPSATSALMRPYLPSGLRKLIGLIGLNTFVIYADTQQDCDTTVALLKLLDTHWHAVWFGISTIETPDTLSAAWFHPQYSQERPNLFSEELPVLRAQSCYILSADVFVPAGISSINIPAPRLPEDTIAIDAVTADADKIISFSLRFLPCEAARPDTTLHVKNEYYLLREIPAALQAKLPAPKKDHHYVLWIKAQELDIDRRYRAYYMQP